MATTRPSTPSISIDQLTEAALAGVHRAIDARPNTSIVHGPILVGIVAWPDARAGLHVTQPGLPSER
jgi:hypothetical protein